MRRIALIAPLFLVFACGEQKKDYEETEYDKQISKYLEDKEWKDEVERLDNGLYIYKEKEGSNEKPTLEDFVTIHYKGALLNGEVFDGTDKEPATFPLAGLIKGWQEGIPHFGKGGKGKLIIPPSLGYGDQDSGPIPANSVLVFDIELLDFSKTPPAPQIVKDKDYSEEIKAYLKEKGIEKAQVTESGLFIVIEEPGTDEKPKLTDFLTLNYEGKLIANDSIFDGTNGSAITFPFPMHQLIPGWQEGIPYFGKGGKGKLIIPPYLAYGDRDIPGIPANSVLSFDVELIDFSENPPAQPQQGM
jgi:FKBP-type peptidyl-prolyl cis-trans isomerase